MNKLKYMNININVMNINHLFILVDIINKNMNRIQITLIPSTCSKALTRERLKSNLNNMVLLFIYL
jgi:hypothetical protein